MKISQENEKQIRNFINENFSNFKLKIVHHGLVVITSSCSMIINLNQIIKLVEYFKIETQDVFILTENDENDNQYLKIVISQP